GFRRRLRRGLPPGGGRLAVLRAGAARRVRAGADPPAGPARPPARRRPGRPARAVGGRDRPRARPRRRRRRLPTLDGPAGGRSRRPLFRASRTLPPAAAPAGGGPVRPPGGPLGARDGAGLVPVRARPPPVRAPG